MGFIYFGTPCIYSNFLITLNWFCASRQNVLIIRFLVIVFSAVNNVLNNKVEMY